MPTVTQTKHEVRSGSSLDVLVVGTAYAGKIIVDEIREIVLNYDRIDGESVIEEGMFDGECYRIISQAHTLVWKAYITVKQNRTVDGTIRRFLRRQGQAAETAGGVVAAAGGVILLFGGGIGGPISGVGGIFWAVGGILQKATEPLITYVEEMREESGQKSFASVTAERIECEPGKEYPLVVLPEPDVGLGLSEGECVRDILAGL